MKQSTTIHETEPSRVSYALSCAILLGGLLTIVFALHMAVITYSMLPFWDEWREFEFAANGGNVLSPAWLWQQHNEHRLVIPKLFLASDLLLFRGRQVFLLASIFAIQLMHLALLSWSMRVLGGWRGALWRTGTGLAAFCLFCPSQYANLIWPFQVCFVLVHFLATLSLVALLLYWTQSQIDPDKPPGFLIVSILAAVGATYSLANGNLVWPLLIAAALYLRLRVRDVLSLCITGGITTGLYLYHYVRPERVGAPVIATLGKPLALLEYCAGYLTSSWLHGDARVLVQIAGTNGHKRQLIAFAALAVLAILAALLQPGRSYVRIFRPFAVQLVFTIFFCGGTVFITAIGRVHYGIEEAATSRYQTVALLFWCSLGLLWLGTAFFGRSRRAYSFPVAQLLLLVIFVRGAILAKNPLSQARAHGFSQKAATAALIAGVNDPAMLRLIDYEPETLSKTVPYIMANRLAVFSGGASSELGKSLKSVFPLARPDDCAGSLESVVVIDSPSGPGLRILGWALDRKHRHSASTVVVTANGIIAGLGAVGEWPRFFKGVIGEGWFFFRANPGLPSRPDGFIAFVSDRERGSSVEVYAILRGDPALACYIDRVAWQRAK